VLQAREADVVAVLASIPLATAEEVANAELELKEHDAKVDEVKQQLNQAEAGSRRQRSRGCSGHIQLAGFCSLQGLG